MPLPQYPEPSSLLFGCHSKKSELLMNIFVCLLFLSSLFRSSAVSVVLTFNNSHSDAAPVFPISLSVDVNRKGKK